MSGMTDACGEVRRHQCGISVRHVCDGCMLNPATDASDVPCLECAHFGSFMPQSAMDYHGREFRHRRVYCKGVTRYVPKKIYTWTFNDLPRYIRDAYGERVHCADFEKAKKGRRRMAI
jgi:hypothetical protein